MESIRIIIHPREDKKKELLLACRMISDQTRQEAGCMDSHVLFGNDDANRIKLDQQWGQQSFLNDYFRSNHFSALLGAMKLLAKNYEVTINGGTREDGVTAVEKARTT
jgi:quinol monooxygenase YgiN